MPKLAINGGIPIREASFPNQVNIGMEERLAVDRVMDRQMLSGYRGNAQKYRGGREIRAFEKMFQEKFNVKHAIAVNSCTSALHVACMAIDLQPGDEVIVSPYSMTCSATIPMLCGATPIFADVEPLYFCIDPDDVERKITNKTKAIIAVDIFGQPFNEKINEIAEKHNIIVIEDAAQAIGAERLGKVSKSAYTGTLGDMGCFSFTQGKHITAGEGGMVTTNNDKLAMKCRLLMNHAEAVINDIDNTKPVGDDMAKMYGLNLRMTELQAAIAAEQLKKLDFFIGKRQENAKYLANALNNAKIPVTASLIRPNCTHTYYCQAFHYLDGLAEGIHRDTFINAVKAELTGMDGREDEGVRMGNGYIKPLYRMPVFRHRFQDVVGNSERLVTDNIFPLPNVEKLWRDDLFLHLYLAPPTTRADLDDIIEAFVKVWENREELR